MNPIEEMMKEIGENNDTAVVDQLEQSVNSVQDFVEVDASAEIVLEIEEIQDMISPLRAVYKKNKELIDLEMEKEIEIDHLREDLSSMVRFGFPVKRTMNYVQEELKQFLNKDET